MAAASFRNKVITGIVLLLACFLVAYFVATPFWHKYSDSKQQLQSTQKQISQLNDQLASVANFVNTYQSYSQQSAAADKALPPGGADTAGLLSSLNSVAAAAGLTLADIQFQEGGTSDKPAAPNAIQVIHVDLAASGPFLAFKDFMLRLENNLRLFDLDHVSMSADGSGVIHYQMVLKTYYQK